MITTYSALSRGLPLVAFGVVYQRLPALKRHGQWLSDGTNRCRARISPVDRLEYFLRSRGAKVVVLALVANTMVAQLLYNSAGQLVLGNRVLLGYLIFSAICSTVAFALFEVCTIFQLHDLMTLDASIKQEIGAEKLIKRGYFVLAVSSLDQLHLGALLPGARLAHRPGVGTNSRWIICPSPGTGSITPCMPRPTPPSSSWQASSASGPSAAKK